MRATGSRIVRSQPGGHPVAHLAGRAAAEGEHQHLVDRDPGADPRRHRLDQRGRLARARPGQHEQRAAVVLDDAALVGVEHRRDRGGARRADEPVGGFGHARHPNTGRRQFRPRPLPSCPEQDGDVITAGIDLAASPATTGLAVLSGRRIVELAVGVDDDALVTACDGHGAVKIGIDSPLGWPRAFVAMLADPAVTAAGRERRRSRPARLPRHRPLGTRLRPAPAAAQRLGGPHRARGVPLRGPAAPSRAPRRPDGERPGRRDLPGGVVAAVGPAVPPLQGHRRAGPPRTDRRCAHRRARPRPAPPGPRRAPTTPWTPSSPASPPAPPPSATRRCPGRTSWPSPGTRGGSRCPPAPSPTWTATTKPGPIEQMLPY